MYMYNIHVHVLYMPTHTIVYNMLYCLSSYKILLNKSENIYGLKVATPLGYCKPAVVALSIILIPVF